MQPRRPRAPGGLRGSGARAAPARGPGPVPSTSGRAGPPPPAVPRARGARGAPRVAQAGTGGVAPSPTPSLTPSQTAEETPAPGDGGEALEREARDMLEWRRVGRQVAAFAATAAAAEAALRGELPAGASQAEAEALLAETAAARRLIAADGGCPVDFEGVLDVRPLLELAAAPPAPEAEPLSVLQADALAATVEACLGLGAQLRFADAGPELRALAPAADGEVLGLLELLRECVGPGDRRLRSEASRELQEVRELAALNGEELAAELRREAERLARRTALVNKQPLVRRDRLCLAVRRGLQGELPGGVILGESNTGSTFYMEPRGVVELNNTAVYLRAEEKQEERRILSELTRSVAAAAGPLRAALDAAHALDLVLARGAHAHWLGGARPVLGRALELRGVCHPLLLEAALPPLPPVVPRTTLDDWLAVRTGGRAIVLQR